MSAANPVAAPAVPVRPRAAAKAQPVTVAGRRRRGPAPARILAFVILAVFALAWRTASPSRPI